MEVVQQVGRRSSNGGIAWIACDSRGRGLVTHTVAPTGEYRESSVALP